MTLLRNKVVNKAVAAVLSTTPLSSFLKPLLKNFDLIDSCCVFENQSPVLFNGIINETLEGWKYNLLNYDGKSVIMTYCTCPGYVLTDAYTCISRCQSKQINAHNLTVSPNYPQFTIMINKYSNRLST